MGTATVLIIAIAALLVLGVGVGVTSARRRDSVGQGHLSRETLARDRKVLVDVGASSVGSASGREIERAAVLARSGGDLEVAPDAPPPAEWTPPDPEVIGVTRRQFLNRSAVTLMGLSLTGFGVACIAFLWPQAKGGFGSRISIGSVADVEAAIDSSSPAPNFSYFAEAQSYVVRFPTNALEAARAAYPANIVEGMEAGYTALWQKCPHLGCRVPECATSQWFECPCHGSKYSRVGEKKAGPAPRGLDRFPVLIEDGNMIIDTGAVALGPAIGTDTTAQGAEGPFCTDGGGHS